MTHATLRLRLRLILIPSRNPTHQKTKSRLVPRQEQSRHRLPRCHQMLLSLAARTALIWLPVATAMFGFPAAGGC